MLQLLMDAVCYRCCGPRGTGSRRNISGANNNVAELTGKVEGSKTHTQQFHVRIAYLRFYSVVPAPSVIDIQADPPLPLFPDSLLLSAGTSELQHSCQGKSGCSQVSVTSIMQASWNSKDPLAKSWSSSVLLRSDLALHRITDGRGGWLSFFRRHCWTPSLLPLFLNCCLRVDLISSGTFPRTDLKRSTGFSPK